MRKYLISLSNILASIVFLYQFGYGQSQTSGLIKFTITMQRNGHGQQKQDQWSESKKIWFKDSSVIYEIRTELETSESTPQGTVVKKSHPVLRYVYLDLHTMSCQDYHMFKDTAQPFCSYNLKWNDTTDLWKFYYTKEVSDTAPGMSVMSDSMVNNISFKRIKVLDQHYPQQRFYNVYYLNCNTFQNMFNLNRTLNDMYPGCKTTMSDLFADDGNLIFRAEYEILEDKLNQVEEKVFNQWHENAITTKLPKLSYKEARKNCIVIPEHENPTISIIPNK